MANTDDPKARYLAQHGALYTGAERVTDPLFVESEFFDPRDLVLVKYEMLRRVQVDGLSVVEAAKRFGFSRAGFYKALSTFHRGGLVGFIPERPGPRHAHKLTDDVLALIDQQLRIRGKLSASELAVMLLDERDLRVHPRSIERALARREKKGR